MVRSLSALVDHLTKAGVAVRWDNEMLEVRRCYVDDPFGNRIELIEGSEGVPRPVPRKPWRRGSAVVSIRDTLCACLTPSRMAKRESSASIVS